jgi:hypothetical protein
MVRTSRVLAGLALAGLIAGCGPGRVKEENIEIPPQDPMIQVKTTLDRYAAGQPVTSEVTSFDYMVEEVRKVDPAKADILKAGLDDIKKTKGSPAAKAKELIRKLGLDDPKYNKK